jgi:hypothetical protein
MSDPHKTPRSDAKLKRLDDSIQDAVFRYATTPGVTQADARAWLEREHSVKCSAGAFSEFLSWYGARQRAREREQKIAALLDDERNLRPELSDEELFAKGQRMMTLLTMAEEDPKAWAVVQRTARDREDSILSQQKFQRETIAMFLKWWEDKRAMEIASSSAATADKTEQLGKHIFGDLWE